MTVTIRVSVADDEAQAASREMAPATGSLPDLRPRAVRHFHHVVETHDDDSVVFEQS